MRNLITLAAIAVLAAVTIVTYVQSNSLEQESTVKQEIPKNSPIFNTPELSTFANALKAAQLVDLFQGTGPFTAFAPSNQAFEKFGKERLQRLLRPENRDDLSTILIYHIAPGKYPAANLKNMRLKTVNGKNVVIVVRENGEIYVNNAKIIKTDLMGPNGVLHIIDTVLVP